MISSGHCYFGRTIISGDEIIKNNKCVGVDSNESVSHSKMIVAGGNRIRSDNGVLVDPKTIKKGIQATFQNATDRLLIYFPNVKDIIFEQLDLRNYFELYDIMSKLPQYKNLEHIHNISTVNSKGKSNNRIRTGRVLQQWLKKHKFKMINAKLSISRRLVNGLKNLTFSI